MFILAVSLVIGTAVYGLYRKHRAAVEKAQIDSDLLVSNDTIISKTSEKSKSGKKAKAKGGKKSANPSTEIQPPPDSKIEDEKEKEKEKKNEISTGDPPGPEKNRTQATGAPR